MCVTGQIAPNVTDLFSLRSWKPTSFTFPFLLSLYSPIGYLRTDNSDIDQASSFHLTQISLSFTVISDIGRAEVLNDFFASMCTKDDKTTPSLATRVPNETRLDSVTFSPSVVLSAIKKLKANLASGHDGFPPLLFKRCAMGFVEPLSLMFSSFFL